MCACARACTHAFHSHVDIVHTIPNVFRISDFFGISWGLVSGLKVKSCVSEAPYTYSLNTTMHSVFGVLATHPTRTGILLAFEACGFETLWVGV